MKHDFYDAEEVDECLDSDGINSAEEGFMKGYLSSIQGIYTYRVSFIYSLLWLEILWRL